MVEGLEILFDENLRNQKFIKASEQKIKKFLKNKCLPNMWLLVYRMIISEIMATKVYLIIFYELFE